MGTRHLTCVVQNGDFKVAQYGQWDGYPEGQGFTVLSFLRGQVAADPTLAAFRQAVADSHWVTPEEQAEIDKAFPDEWMTMGEAASFREAYPSLTRDTGAGVLALLPCLLNDNRAFAADGLFCEWVWLIDLDANVLEAYDGFHKRGEAIEGRFKDMEVGEDSEYLPVSLRASWPLDQLPDEATFLAAFEDEDEEGGEEE